MSQVKVYGADWCSMTQQTLSYLDEKNVPYDYVNIEKDDRAREWVKRQNEGKERKPTLDVGGEILSEPSDSELESVLRRKHVVG